MARTRCGVQRLPRFIARPATSARCNSSSAIQSWKAPSDISGLTWMTLYISLSRLSSNRRPPASRRWSLARLQRKLAHQMLRNTLGEAPVSASPTTASIPASDTSAEPIPEASGSAASYLFRICLPISRESCLLKSRAGDTCHRRRYGHFISQTAKSRPLRVDSPPLGETARPWDGDAAPQSHLETCLGRQNHH